MKEEVKAELIRRLESGQVRQASCSLRTSDNAFCCLGVICDIVAPDDWVDPKPDEDFFRHCGDGGFPSLKVRGLADLSWEEIHDLSQLNDLQPPDEPPFSLVLGHLKSS